jgi:hypothetical protein
MEALIDNDQFDDFVKLAENTSQRTCRDIICIEKKTKYCCLLLQKAVLNNNRKFIDYMLNNKFPTYSTYLSDAIKHNDIALLRQLYNAGCRFNTCWGIFNRNYNLNLDIVKISIEEFEYPIIGNFRRVVEHANDEILEWIYKYLAKMPEIISDDNLEIIGPSGYQIAKINHDTKYGFNCYHSAIYYGKLERFLFVANNKIPMYNMDEDFWKELLSENAVCTLEYSKSEWEQRKPERQKILEWCIENEFSFTSKALAAAIYYKNQKLIDLFLTKNILINDKVLSAAILSQDLDFCKKIYKDSALSPNIWISVASNCDQDKLDWLLEINCPQHDNLIANIIKNAKRERLDWLVKNGFKPSKDCWAALSNRYMLNDTEEMLDWLFEHECPLDTEVGHHMDICRPYACDIIDYIDEKLGIKRVDTTSSDEA